MIYFGVLVSMIGKLTQLVSNGVSDKLKLTVICEEERKNTI